MASLPNEIVGEIFNISPEEKIREETISFHALNPFAYNDSSPRLYMASSHIAQSLVLCHGEERIIQSGLDHQLGENTFSVKIEEDCHVVAVVPRYRTVGDESDIVEIFIFVETVSGQYDVYSIPHYFTLHQYFGFEYKTDKRKILSLADERTFLPEGTILADAPCVFENSGLGLGLNANICLTNLPATAQDGVVISESLARKFSYKTFETRTIEFGSNKFLLNLYGDDENYRGFPELGELINKDSLLAVLRETDENMALSLTSKEDLKNYDVDYDHCVYVSSPGEVINNEFGEFKSGKVVDIKAYCNPKAKKNNLYTTTLGTTMKHVDKLKYFHMEVWEVYQKVIKKNLKSINKREDGSFNLTPRLHRLIFDAMVHGEVEKDLRILLSNRYAPLDVFRIEFVIEHYITPTTGHKLSDFNGGKGVIVSVLPDNMMPYTKDGVRADLVMDPTSLASRMNLGRSYEIYFQASIRRARELIREAINKNPKDIEKPWKLVMEFLKIMGTEQYVTYGQASQQEKQEVLKEIMDKEFYVLYRVSSEKKPHIIVQELQRSKFAPLKDKIFIPKSDGSVVETKAEMIIGPLYSILLNKTPDEGLITVSSGRTNHFGLPLGSGTQKHAYPYRGYGVKFLSETEARHYICNGSLKLAAEIKDRANSIETHKLVYQNILKSDTPGYSLELVDRKKHDYGTDMSLKILHSILNVAGVEIVYNRDPLDGFHPICDPRIGFTDKSLKFSSPSRK